MGVVIRWRLCVLRYVWGDGDFYFFLAFWRMMAIGTFCWQLGFFIVIKFPHPPSSTLGMTGRISLGETSCRAKVTDDIFGIVGCFPLAGEACVREGGKELG